MVQLPRGKNPRQLRDSPAPFTSAGTGRRLCSGTRTRTQIIRSLLRKNLRRWQRPMKYYLTVRLRVHQGPACSPLPIMRISLLPKAKPPSPLSSLLFSKIVFKCLLRHGEFCLSPRVWKAVWVMTREGHRLSCQAGLSPPLYRQANRG